ncbi:MAG: M24 family metallopeptidase [Actinomycetes bacterium]
MTEHLERTLTAMADAGLDVMMLGREANVRFVSDVEHLWLSGTRPFAPGCVVVRSTGTVHLLSTSDAGVPAGISRADLFGVSWNPLTIVGRVADLPGVRDARLIGTDGMTPLMEQLLGGFLPSASLVDGEAVLREVRRTKSPSDLDHLRSAVRVGERCLSATLDAVAPGVTERALLARWESTMGRLGVTTPAFEAATCVAGTAPRSIVTDRVLATGDLVNLRTGVLVDGWSGLVSRTRSVGGATAGQTATADRALDALTRTVTACRPGAVVGSLRNGSGVATLDGVGLGHEELADSDTLRIDDVVFVEVFVDSVILGDLAHVGADATVALTTAPYDIT